MCGRYSLHSNPEVVALQFGLESVPDFAPRYNIAPAADVLIVKQDGASIARWGLIPRWAKDPALGLKLNNARAETLSAKGSFRDAYFRRRCLIPANGFYEWKRTGQLKQPYYIRPANDELFAFAGLWETWQGIDTCTVITTEANITMASIHDRMPVLIAPQDYAAWLDPAQRDANELMRFVRPYPAERMSAYRVSPRVSKPDNDDPSLIAELAQAPAQRELL